MSSLLDSLSARLDEQSLRRISGSLGTDQGATSKALAAAVPLLLAGLARNATQPGGAQQLHDALTRDHDGTALEAPLPAPPARATRSSATFWAIAAPRPSGASPARRASISRRWGRCSACWRRS